MKILEVFFQNINCFSWINLIPVLIHLKYWYYHFPASVTISVKFHLSQMKTSLTQSLSCSSSVSLFCATPLDQKPLQVLNISYHMQSQANQSYYQAIYRSKYLMSQTNYPSKSWVFKVRQHGQQQLNLRYKACWILYKIVRAPSSLQPYLCIESTL